jgi:hypothetical protein
MARESGSADIAWLQSVAGDAPACTHIARLEEGILGCLADELAKNAENI